MTGTGPQAQWLPDGRRLHLGHGPIDLIIEFFGPHRNAAYARAVARFETVLTGLVAELPDLRRPVDRVYAFKDPVARRMAAAVAPFEGVFVTPMAAVAGAVADEILAALIKGNAPAKAYVNNGGDIAFHLGPGQTLTSRGAAGDITIRHGDGARGLATSGWQGRSHSFGIADAVTVAARTAAAADVAATLIANVVDLPGHPAIRRQPANLLSPDSDLGARAVTTDVGPLSQPEIETALARGARHAAHLRDRELLLQATLSLRGRTLHICAAPDPILTGDPLHA